MKVLIKTVVVLFGLAGLFSSAMAGDSPTGSQLKGSDPFNLDPFNLNINPQQRVALNNLLAAGPVLAAADSDNATTVPTAANEKYDAAFSVCTAVVPVGHKDFELVNGVGSSSPILEYFMLRGDEYDIKTWKQTLIGKPVHGEFIQQPNGGYVYHPNEEYLGPDQITWVVDAEGKKFKVIMTVWVADVAPEYGGCPPDYELPPADTGDVKGSALDIIELPVDSALDAEALAKLHAFVNFAEGAGLGGNVDITFADLPGGAVGHNQ